MHPDAYWTPRNLTVALLERQQLTGNVWEPGCGTGNVSEVLNEYGHPVISSDIYDYGFPGTVRLNFLTQRPNWSFDSIVTNPPYTGGIIRAWVRRCAQYSPKVLALLLPVNGFADFVDEGLMGEMRLRRIIIFHRRHSRFWHANGFMFSHRWPPCWFVAEYRFSGDPIVHYVR